MNRAHTTSLVGRLAEAAALLGCCLLSACGSSAEPSAVDQGRQLFESKALSRSQLNDYTCATCHETDASIPLSKKAGGALAGVTLRSRFWGGQQADLLGSINACRTYFMSDNQPLAASEERARSLYAYLESLEPGDANPIPFTVVTAIEALPRGDGSRGRALFSQTCTYCHGRMHDGLGRLSERVPILPEDTIAAHPSPQYTARLLRLVFTEKIRHGLFLDYGGVMPPYSSELLSDEDVSDLLEGLDVIDPLAE